MKKSIRKYYNSDVSRIVGELISDGHMQNDYRNLISFYSEHKYLIDSFSKRMNDVFNVSSWIYQDKRSVRYKLFINSKEVLIKLELLGVPSGNKTNQIFLVPDWIYSGSKNIKSNFLSAIFDCEGYIYKTTNKKNGKIRWRIGIEYYKNEKYLDSAKLFMNQIREMLLDFGIISSPVRLKKGNIRKDGSKSIGVRFEIEMKSFKNFYKYINFQI